MTQPLILPAYSKNRYMLSTLPTFMNVQVGQRCRDIPFEGLPPHTELSDKGFDFHENLSIATWNARTKQNWEPVEILQYAVIVQGMNQYKHEIAPEGHPNEPSDMNQVKKFILGQWQLEIYDKSSSYTALDDKLSVFIMDVYSAGRKLSKKYLTDISELTKTQQSDVWGIREDGTIIQTLSKIPHRKKD